MTEDFKKTMLNYFTKNITPGTQSSNGFRDTLIKENNLVSAITEKAGRPASWMGVVSDPNSSNYVVFGRLNSNSQRGFIAVLNSNGEILSIFDSFDSGTKLGGIVSLNYEENGTIYGVDYYNNKYRVILLNNVAVPSQNKYSCKLRASYYINTTYKPRFDNGSNTGVIKKVPGESLYFIYGQSNSNTMLATFKINVGTSNEWNYYLGASLSGNLYIADFVIESQGSSSVAYISYTDNSDPRILHQEYFNGSSLTTTTSVSTNELITGIFAASSQSVYIASCTYPSGVDVSTYEIKAYKYENGLNTLFSYNIESFIPNHRVILVNGILFSVTTGSDSSNNGFARYGIYYNNEFVLGEELDTGATTSFNYGFSVQKNFSLYSFIIQGNSQLFKPSIVIYDNEYSGGSFLSYNSLIAQKGEIYSNNIISFARDLYNKSVFQNSTVSTINVPNNYLNDIPLTPKNLLGTTMTTLVSDVTSISKNIYENLFLNFINTINVIDEDTSNIYPESANYINENINVGTQTNYEDTSMTKIRINFADGSVVQPIEWEDISEEGLMAKQTIFSVYVSSELLSIDFINENEDFIYITKDYDFEVGNIYTVTQKVRIE